MTSDQPVTVTADTHAKASAALSWMLRGRDDEALRLLDLLPPAERGRAIAAAARIAALAPQPINRASRHTIPGLDGVWRNMGLSTTNLGEDGRAELYMHRVEPGS